MKSVSTFVLVISMSWPIVSLGQTSPWTEGDWLPLVNEPSRSDLQRLAPRGEFDSESVKLKFQFPQDAASGGIYGIDVSHYSPSNLPFSKLAAAGVRYVYAKATQGTAFKDSKFSLFWTSLGALPESLRVWRGAYHFLSATDDPGQQAERFVAYVNLHGGFKSGDLPPVVDLEWDPASGQRDLWSKRSSKQIIAAVLTFLQRVQALTGRAPMVYTSKAWWKERGMTEAETVELAAYKIWAADYSAASIKSGTPHSPSQAILWQFTNKAKVPNLPGSYLDANVFQGTLDEFMQAFTDSRDLANRTCHRVDQREVSLIQSTCFTARDCKPALR